MSNRPLKICALCREQSVLCNSHLIAAGFSRQLRNEGEPNPNPFKISWGVKVQTSHQFTAYLLCEGCEDRLRRYGEDSVITACAKINGEFPLRKVIEQSAPLEVSGEWRVYSVPVEKVEADRIVFFAASVFWRAAVCRFSDTKHLSALVELGPRYTEEFRQYLLGEAAFPSNAAVVVTISSRRPVLITTATPITLERSPLFHHFFQVPGIGFDLYVGNAIHQSVFKQYCFATTANHLILHTDSLDKTAAKAQYLGPRKLAASQE